MSEPLKWITTKPTEPGWYWLRYRPDASTTLVFMARVDHALSGGKPRKANPLMATIGFRRSRKVDRYDAAGCEWSERIPEPKES